MLLAFGDTQLNIYCTILAHLNVQRYIGNYDIKVTILIGYKIRLIEYRVDILLRFCPRSTTNCQITVSLYSMFSSILSM